MGSHTGGGCGGAVGADPRLRQAAQRSGADLAQRAQARAQCRPDTSLKVALEVEGHSYEKLRWSEDYMEGIDAFSERRKARYKGR